MENKTINEIEKIYNLGLDKVVEEIFDNKNKVKLILLQFPDGLKPYATAIVDYLEEKTSAEFLIWFGSCFGACDIPVGIENLKIDLVVQFGHNELIPDY